MIKLIGPTDDEYNEIITLCESLFGSDLTEPVSKDIIVDIEQDIRAFCSVKYEEGIYLQYFAVTEKYRQQGIGKGLLGWILDHYKCNIYLHVRINNCVAINLYESMGFVRESEDQEWYYYAAAASSLNNF